jgi:membrane-bound ClpP family serine protease
MANIKKNNRFFLTTMIGTSGRAASALNPEGTVNIKGELWQAVATDAPISSGELITVVAQDELTLTVSRRDKTGANVI